MGKPTKGVKEALQKIRDKGCYIRIFSCRTSIEVCRHPIDRSEQVRKMEAYLDEHEIPYDEVLNKDKPIGIYIDDKAIGFRDNWDQVLEEMENLNG